MASRDLIQEILEIRGRLRYGDAFREFGTRLLQLDGAFEKRNEVDAEFLNYFPVALVACLEGFLRLSVKELIDSGSPFLDNAAKLSANIRFDFPSVKALHGKKITIGEFIAHHLSWNNLSFIESNLSALLGKSCLDALRTVTDRWESEVKGKAPSRILADPDLTFRHIARAFELRHIICHETATNFKISLAEIEEIYPSSIAFLSAANNLVSEAINPNAPLTQAAMNEASAKDLKASMDQLDHVNQALTAKLGEPGGSKWRAVNQAWQTFAGLAADFQASSYEGGSIQPLIYNTAAKRLADEQLAYVRRQLEQEDL